MRPYMQRGSQRHAAEGEAGGIQSMRRLALPLLVLKMKEESQMPSKVAASRGWEWCPANSQKGNRDPSPATDET